MIAGLEFGEVFGAVFGFGDSGLVFDARDDSVFFHHVWIWMVWFLLRNAVADVAVECVMVGS